MSTWLTISEAIVAVIAGSLVRRSVPECDGPPILPLLTYREGPTVNHCDTPACGSSLHSIPNHYPSIPTSPDSASTQLVHAYGYAHRLALRVALSFDLQDHKDRDRLDACGSSAWVEHSPSTDAYRIRASHCGLRSCPRCGRRYALSAADHVREYARAAQGTELKLISLTLRHTSAPLADQLDHLVASWRRLRQRKIWRSHVTSGYGVIEIEYNAAQRQWHPHLHVLAYCSYIPQHALATAWLGVTHTSMIVDIRLVRTPERAASYIAKYLGKPPNLDGHADHHDLLREWHRAIRHRRMLIPVGGAPPMPHNYKPPITDPTDWEPVATLDSLLDRCRSHDPDAERMVTSALRLPLSILHRILADPRPPPPPHTLIPDYDWS